MSNNTPHFNQLTPEQDELINLLSEECGEVVQMVGKINRHGLLSRHPDGGPTNDVLLAIEIGDIMAAVDQLIKYGIIHQNDIDTAKRNKLLKVQRYLHHAQVKP